MGAHPSKLQLPLRLKVIFLMDALIKIFGRCLHHNETIEWVLHSTRFLGVLCLYLCQKDLYANRRWFVLLLSLRIDGARKWSKVMAPALQQMKVNVLQGVQHASLRQPPDGRNRSVTWPDVKSVVLAFSRSLLPRPHRKPVRMTDSQDPFFFRHLFFLLIYFACVFIFVVSELYII